MPYLKQSVNGQVVSLIEIKGQVYIGREASCNIVLEDPTVSQKHALLELDDDHRWLLSDCDSTNGLRVNGKKTRSSVLQEGSSFSIGTHDFEFLLEQPQQLDKTLRIKKSWIPGVYYTE